MVHVRIVRLSYVVDGVNREDDDIDIVHKNVVPNFCLYLRQNIDTISQGETT